MLYNAFTIYDSKACYYYPPIFMKTRAEFVRSLRDTVSDSSTVFHKHPEDFVAYSIGTFEDTDAVFSPSALDHVCNVSDLLVA
jgi:hypothetical protein